MMKRVELESWHHERGWMAPPWRTDRVREQQVAEVSRLVGVPRACSREFPTLRAGLSGAEASARERRQRRVYLKRGGFEPHAFTDKTFPALRKEAHEAGLKTGAYFFPRPQDVTPQEASDLFLRLLPEPIKGKDLRPCLDLEHGRSSPKVGRWAIEFQNRMREQVGVLPLFYSYASYVEGLALAKPIGPLWLAAYGRNDGKEHPFRIPRPYKTAVAHQYSSRCRLVGCSGFVDISHVFNPRALEAASADL
jgi:GH25 family lysozyme M1 (1,4-beta-N-acetylmuramidase)